MDYESEILRNWYLLFHYGTPGEILEGSAFTRDELPRGCLDFPVATVAAAGTDEGAERALDLGCAVGRSTFELSKFAGECLGLDYSGTFIEAAETLRGGGEIAYHRYGEGHRPEPLAARRPEGARPERISFATGDATNLPSELGSFDLVHAANLLCRLPQPRRLLDRLPRLVRPRGRLVLATPASWSETYTARAEQPVGETLDFLKGALEPDFELVSVVELPFLLREHRRKFQISTSQTSLWRRR